MTRVFVAGLSFLIASGCGGSRGPIYEFQPTAAPLRYQVIDHGKLLIETPMGEQRSVDSTKATLRVEIGGRDASGHQVSVVFESLDLWSGGDFNAEHIEGGELIGRIFSGRLSDQGIITISEAPEIPASIAGNVDPATIFTDLLLPLPPAGGESADSWSHATTQGSEATMSTQSTYEGMARFVGDTTWNGQSVRVIVSEGATKTSARGTPSGAPGEIEMVLNGKSATRYFWDPDRGAMLAYRATTTADGELEVLGMAMSMPVAYEGSKEVRLLP